MIRQSHKPIPMTAPLDADSDVQVHRFWWCKRLAVVIVLGAVGVTASWRAWSARARHRIAVAERAWRADGLTLVATELQAGWLPENENALTPLSAAVEAYESDRDYEHLSRRDDFNRSDPGSWTPGRRQIVDRMLARNAPVRRLIRQAAARPRIYWTPKFTEEYDESSEFWMRIRPVTAMLMTHAAVSISDGDDAAFIEDISSAHAMRRFLALCPALQACFLGESQASWISEALTDRIAGLTLRGGTAVRRKADALLAELLNEPAPQDNLVLTLENEAAKTLSRGQSRQQVNTRTPMPDDAFGRAAWRLLRPAAIGVTLEALARMRQDMVTIRSNPVANPGRLWNGAARAQFLLTFEPAESLLVGFWPDEMSHADHLIKNVYEAALDQRISCIVLACHLYRADHDGKLPTALIQLVPGYLPSVPIDPFDPLRLPMRYTTATTQPFVYSVGPSGKDYIAAGSYVPTAGWERDVNPGAFIHGGPVK